ncbi:hypothetical protein SRHO_G00294280 [Serrasalmus rhombeus]
MLLHTAVQLVLLLGLGSWAEGLCPDDLDSSCKQNPYKEPVSSGAVVSYEQLKQMLESENVQLFDVREPDEFVEGAIPGATNTPPLFISLDLTSSLFVVLRMMKKSDLSLQTEAHLYKSDRSRFAPTIWFGSDLQKSDFM